MVETNSQTTQTQTTKTSQTPSADQVIANYTPSVELGNNNNEMDRYNYYKAIAEATSKGKDVYKTDSGLVYAVPAGQVVDSGTPSIIVGSPVQKVIETLKANDQLVNSPQSYNYGRFTANTNNPSYLTTTPVESTYINSGGSISPATSFQQLQLAAQKQGAYIPTGQDIYRMFTRSGQDNAYRPMVYKYDNEGSGSILNIDLGRTASSFAYDVGLGFPGSVASVTRPVLGEAFYYGGKQLDKINALSPKETIIPIPTRSTVQERSNIGVMYNQKQPSYGETFRTAGEFTGEALPYVAGESILGPTKFATAMLVAGTAGTIAPRLSTEQRLNSALIAGTSAVSLGITNPNLIPKALKTDINLIETKYSIYETIPKFEQTPKSAGFIKMGERSGSEIVYDVFGRFKGFPMEQTAIEKGMPPKLIEFGRNVEATKQTPLRKLFGLSPKPIPREQAIKELIQGGYNEKYVQQLFRRQYNLPEYIVKGTKTQYTLGDEVKIEMNADINVRPIKNPKIPVRSFTPQQYKAVYRGEPTDVFGIPGIKGEQKIINVNKLTAQDFVNGDLKSIDFFQKAVGKDEPGVVLQINKIPSKNIEQRNILPVTFTKVDTLSNKIVDRQLQKLGGNVFAPSTTISMPGRFVKKSPQVFEDMFMVRESYKGFPKGPNLDETSGLKQEQIYKQTQNLGLVNPQVPKVSQITASKSITKEVLSSTKISPKAITGSLSTVSVVRNANIQEPQTLTKTKTALLELQKSDQQTKQLTKELLGTARLSTPKEQSIQIQKPLQKQSQEQRSVQATTLVNRSQSKLAQESISRLQSKISNQMQMSRVTEKFMTPKVAWGGSSFKGIKTRVNPKVESPLLTVEFRRQGQFFPIGKTTNIQSAIGIGKSAARQTLGASFRIRTPKGNYVPLSPSEEFRLGKGTGILVQRAPKRLSSIGERVEIIKSRRNTGGGFLKPSKLKL